MGASRWVIRESRRWMRLLGSRLVVYQSAIRERERLISATLRPSARTREKLFTNSSKCPRLVETQILKEADRTLLETIQSISPMALFCLLLTPPAVTTSVRFFRRHHLLLQAD